VLLPPQNGDNALSCLPTTMMTTTVVISVSMKNHFGIFQELKTGCHASELFLLLKTLIVLFIVSELFVWLSFQSWPVS